MGSIEEPSTLHSSPSFSAPPEQHIFDALLLDMDGTIIDSTAAIVKFWRSFGERIGVSGDLILQTSHGRRTMDVLAIHCPEQATWDTVLEAEGSIPPTYGKDAKEVPGARVLLDSLEAEKAKWAIVTSGTRPLVQGWLDVMGLAQPRCMVTAEDVERGKPDPACYLMGAEKLGVKGRDVLVLEDSPAGVKAGKAAGFRVCAVATTHDVQKLQDAGADWIVRDLRSLQLKGCGDGRASVEIRDAVVV